MATTIGVLALLFLFIKLPKILKKSPRGGYKKLLKNNYLIMGVIGIFVYVGAEVTIGSYLVNYFLDMNLASVIIHNDLMNAMASRLINKDLSQVDSKAVVGAFVVFYWSGAMIGRFIGAYLTKVIKPSKVLIAFAFLAIIMLIVSLSSTGLIAMFSILAVGLFNSIMFPTIFSLSLEGLGDLKPQASGLLCMAIVGGAIIPPLYGLLTDNLGFKTALLLVVGCYAYILFFGYKKPSVSKLSPT